MRLPPNILLIEDDPDDREIFESIVQNIMPAAKCMNAENGQHALDILTNGSSMPHVIFLDLNMPLMNGKQFLMEIKKYPEIQRIPVIVLSTSSDAGIVAETRLLGATDFITKPDRLAQWEDALRKFFREQSFPTENGDR